MKIITMQNYQELSLKAADLVTAVVKANARAVIGLATGSTPEGMYKELIKRFKKGRLDFAQVVFFNVDEYLGLSPEHKQSYHYYMRTKFFDYINVRPENVHIPAGCCKDLERECEDYDRKIAAAGGLDLQILGLGPNGHIGFNEPASALLLHTHLAKLTPNTMETNSRFFVSKEEMPKMAITMGMGAIMAAKKIILLASGTNKAPVIKQMCAGKVTTAVPASLLQLHRDLTVVVDLEAASLLQAEDN